MILGRNLALALLLILVFTGSSLFLLQNLQWFSPAVRSRPFKAALIDELAVTSPDPYLIQNVTSNMRRAGYTVDYYGPKNVTVDLLKGLPSDGYGVVILRDHSTTFQTREIIGIVTSELFSQEKYRNEQQAGQVIRVRVGDANADYFGITPTFVRETMQGTFSNTVVIVMGCAGLANTEMAQAFVARGAEVYISWDQVVYANRSDGGVILLLQSMTKGHRIDEAVAWATENAPLSRDDSSRLGYYPLDKGGLVLNLAHPN
jgi:hypothetical protein